VDRSSKDVVGTTSFPLSTSHMSIFHILYINKSTKTEFLFLDLEEFNDLKYKIKM
jgi:hypothetical protein